MRAPKTFLDNIVMAFVVFTDETQTIYVLKTDSPPPKKKETTNHLHENVA